MMKRWSTKRELNRAIKTVVGLGYDEFDDLEISGFTQKNASIYIWVTPLGLSIRISDHPQPPYGGFQEGRGRMGEADFNIEPRAREKSRYETKADRAQDLRWWLIECIAYDALPHLNGDDDLMCLGRA